MTIVHIADYENSKDNGIKEVVLTLKVEQEKLGNTVYIFNIFRNQNTSEYEIYIFDLDTFKNKINIFKPDIVIFHSVYKLNYIAFYRFLKRVKIPYLVEPHGGTTIENMRKSYLKKKLANIIMFNNFIANAKAISYLNKYECEKCVFKAVRKGSLIIPNGIYLPSIKLTGSEKPRDKIHFTFLARIDIHHKGIDLLLDAISILCKTQDIDKFTFNFYGSSDSESDVIYLTKRLTSIAPNLFYHNQILGDQKVIAFINTNIYVLTSRYEGMPLSVLEALSYGNPCIITPQTNMQDIIAGNSCGWITLLDSQSIANTLFTAMNDYSKKRNEYINNSIKSVQSFTWDLITKQTICEYSKIITCYGKVV